MMTEKLEDLRANYRYWQGFKMAVDEMSIGVPVDELMKLAYKKHKELEDKYVSATAERIEAIEGEVSNSGEGKDS